MMPGYSFAGLTRRQAMAALAGIGAAALTSRRAQAAAQRIVCVGGAITEIVYALGEGGRIIAVDTTSLFPAQAVATLPKVGYLRMLSTEGVLSTKPDLVLLDTDAGPADVVDQLRHLQTPIAQFTEHPSAQSVADKIIFVGKTLGEEVKATTIATLYRQDLAEIEQAVIGLSQRPSALFLMNAGATGLRGAGSGTGAAAMIDLAGGRNAFGETTGYKTVSVEATLAANPDIILMMSQTIAELGGVDNVATLPALAPLAAAREKRIFGIDGNYLLGFGPRTAHAVRDLAALLHPQATLPVLPARPWTIS